MKLIFATQNQNKVKELQALMPNFIELHSLKDIGCEDDIPETAKTLEGNASQKSKYVVDKFQVNCFSDDTGLEVDALGGAPGVYSARYAGPQKNSEDNMDLLLKNLEGESNRKARFRTVISLILNEKEFMFDGIVEGHISESKMGEKGFGYDPVFIPDGFTKSFAQMSANEKNAISHRGRAVEKLIQFLKKEVNV